MIQNDYDDNVENDDNNDAMSCLQDGDACDARALCKRAIKYNAMLMQVGREVKWAFLHKRRANRLLQKFLIVTIKKRVIRSAISQMIILKCVQENRLQILI